MGVRERGDFIVVTLFPDTEGVATIETRGCLLVYLLAGLKNRRIRSGYPAIVVFVDLVCVREEEFVDVEANFERKIQEV